MASILFGERLTSAGYVGLVVGVLGLCLLEIPEDGITTFIQGKLSLALACPMHWQGMSWCCFSNGMKFSIVQD